MVMSVLDENTLAVISADHHLTNSDVRHLLVGVNMAPLSMDVDDSSESANLTDFSYSLMRVRAMPPSPPSRHTSKTMK